MHDILAKLAADSQHQRECFLSIEASVREHALHVEALAHVAARRGAVEDVQQCDGQRTRNVLAGGVQNCIDKGSNSVTGCHNLGMGNG